MNDNNPPSEVADFLLATFAMQAESARDRLDLILDPYYIPPKPISKEEKHESDR